MNTLFLTLGRPNIARNLFTKDFWESLPAIATQIKIVILIPTGCKIEYEALYPAAPVQWQEVKPRFPSRATTVITSLMRNAINSHTNLWSKMRSVERGDTSRVTTLFKRAYTATLGALPSWRRLLRALLIRYGTPTKEVADLFDHYQPTLVFITGLTEYEFDVPLACEAKRRGIRLLGMTRSWDNFSSHGLTRVLPDTLIVQNIFLRDMAKQYQAINPDLPNIIVGTPHYDRYFGATGYLRPRETFFRELGLDPSKRIVLYAAMGDFMFPYENSLADVFEGLVDSGAVPADVQFVYRPHPKFLTNAERIRAMKHVRLDEQTSEAAGSINEEMKKWELTHLIHLLAYSDVVINTASTMAIEGALFDKPVICIGFDGTKKQAPYWLSAKRFFDCFTHFEDLVATGSLPVAQTETELARLINEALEHPEKGQAGREKIKERFVAPFDGRASGRLMEVLKEEVRKAA
ncbi:CDP-glycerol glycerophosphotransferase family protein [Patescibacteria group bacterium]|nr:CDP-glycerol glycerophosphotransferase family protein [Patescibacteria group bacterium]